MVDVDKKSELLIEVINLVETSEHMFMNWIITEDETWLEDRATIDEIRKRKQIELQKEEDSQLHCINKHLFSDFKRAQELGDKEWRDGNKEKALENYNDAKVLLNIFYKRNFQEETKEDKEIKKSFWSRFERREENGKGNI